MENIDPLYQEFLSENTSKLEAEQKEADLLIDHGFKITIGKRVFHIKPLRYGTITMANKYAIQLKVNLLSDDNTSVFKEMEKNIGPLMSFIAVCILHDRWKIILFTKLLAAYLKWKLDPKTALKMSIAILQMYDIKNFITSIKLIGQLTITSPKETGLVDGKQQVSNQYTEPPVSQ